VEASYVKSFIFKGRGNKDFMKFKLLKRNRLEIKKFRHPEYLEALQMSTQKINPVMQFGRIFT